ncbi:PseG/SpsG family protein [Acetoanaerobium noterae]|uniref:PseG/SpsG family protein n=1 Tax=Acetoanaerobium noterae TaxID=745369 RepID=UPI0032422260
MESSQIKKIVFRTIGGGDCGYGHYYRCISLANALNYFGNVKIEFIINKELVRSIDDLGFEYIICNDLKKDNELLKDMRPDIFIFDSYLGNNYYLEKVSELTTLVLFDDNNDIYDSTIPNMIINGNIHAQDLEYKKKKEGIYLLGTKYLVMKQEYWSLLNNDNNYSNKKFSFNNNYFNILITTGGSDQYRISLKVIEVLLTTSYEKKVIIGPSYEDDLIIRLKNIEEENSTVKLIYNPDSLKESIVSSDIVITAGGSTIYEALSQHKFPIIFSLADNQDILCSKLKEMGLSYIGKHPNIKFEKILSKIDKIYQMKRNNEFIDFNFHKTIDGNGALRIADKILNLL